MTAPVVALRESGDGMLMAGVPEAVGSVNVAVPAAACGVIVTVPLVEPARPRVPSVVPGTPSTGVAVPATVLAVADARIVPAAVVAG